MQSKKQSYESPPIYPTATDPALFHIPGSRFIPICSAPDLLEVSARYRNITQFTVTDTFRYHPEEGWVPSNLIATRTDKAVTQNGEALLLQSSQLVRFKDGSLNFENSALYGVDKRSRQNIPELGDLPRGGQFFFTPNTKKQAYVIWDAMFIGPREAAFLREEEMDGLPVYLFSFRAAGLDETDGYRYLPLVPEVYRAQTDGEGVITVEPLSGIIVDYQDRGTSYYFDTQEKTSKEDIHKWSQQVTPQTRNEQIQLALQARRQTKILEEWIPGGLILLGGTWMFYGGFGFRAKKPLKKKKEPLK